MIYEKLKLHFLPVFISLFVLFVFSTTEGFAKEKNPRKELSKAIAKGNQKQVSKLMDSRQIEMESVYEDRTPLAEACQHGKPALIKYFIEKGANVDGETTRTPLTELIRESLTHKLQTKKLYDSVELLLSSGADVNLSGVNGYSPLMQACIYSKDKKLIQLLWKKGADLDFQAMNEKTPLVVSIQANNFMAFCFLLEQGADLCIEYKKNPIFGVCCVESRLMFVKELVNKGYIDVNERGRLTFTPLMAAAMAGEIPIFKFLIESGADINAEITSEFYLEKENGFIKNSYILVPTGATALSFAKYYKRTATIQMLEELGAEEYNQSEIGSKTYNDWLRPYWREFNP